MGSYFGYTLCANICTYQDAVNNRGSPADNFIVQKYFGDKLKFESHSIEENPVNNNYITKGRFTTELEKAIAITKEKNYPKLIVVIISHGGEENIDDKLQQRVYFYDEPESIDDVLFKKLGDPELDNVEKIVWLEMCRVNTSNQVSGFDAGVSIKLVDDIDLETFAPARENVIEHCNPNLPPKCVVLFGCPSGKVSFTNPQYGSRTLRALQTVMDKIRINEEIRILSLLKKVIWQMSMEDFKAKVENQTVNLTNNGSILHRLTVNVTLKILK